MKTTVGINADLKELIKGKNFLVTGGTGSIGSEIVRNLLKYDPKVVRILSNSENELFELQTELKSWEERLRFLVGDVRIKDRLLKAMKGIDYVFHAAALKHVPLCEYNPYEAVLTNVIGTNNVIDAAISSEIKKLINISTDKAVNPISTMGACKLLGEKIISSTSQFPDKTTMYSVRFGNVLGSRGSILRVIRDKILKDEPIPITDENMTRFIMTIPDAVNLVLETMLFGKGGETFVLKMKKVKIIDLINTAAEYYCKMYHKDVRNVKINCIGKRIGEKLSEALLALEEIEYAYETQDMILIPPNPNYVDINAKYFPHPRLSAKRMALSRYDSDMGPFLSRDEIWSILEEIPIE